MKKLPEMAVNINGDLGAKEWRRDTSKGMTQYLTLEEKQELANRANAYPKLIERTEKAAMTVFNPSQFVGFSDEQMAAINRGWDAAMNSVWERNVALLRELGETS